MKFPTAGPTRASATVLVLANLVPVAGIFLWGWDRTTILFGYWAESAIIGFFSLLRFWTAKAPIAGKIFLSLFFTLHFGGFMFGHLMALQHFLFPHPVWRVPPWGDHTVFFRFPNLAEPQSGGPGETLSSWILRSSWFLGAVFLSHGISFFLHLGRKTESSGILAAAFWGPYLRVFPMHIAIIAGGIASSLLFGSRSYSGGSGLAVCLALIAAKLCIDLASHLFEKGKLQNAD